MLQNKLLVFVASFTVTLVNSGFPIFQNSLEKNILFKYAVDCGS